MPSRLQRQFHVTGTQYISTDKVQSKTLNTGGTAEDYFSPWAISPGRFLLYLLITANYLPSQSRGYSQSASLLAQQNQRSAILPPVLTNTQLGNLFVFGCICRSRVDLSAWKSALFRKISLSERSEFEIFLNAFSRFSDT